MRKDGSQIQGEFDLNGKENGRIVEINTNGTVYIRHYLHGKWEGQSVQIFPDGEKSVCSYVVGKVDGLKTKTSLNGN